MMLTPDPNAWRELATAYNLHHFACHVCIAAGRGAGYGLRCGVGAALWRSYEEPQFCATLLDGRTVAATSDEWLAESGARLVEARSILGIREKQDRIARLAVYAADMGKAAALLPGVDPLAYAAEARRRLEVVILDCWRRDHEAASALASA